MRTQRSDLYSLHFYDAVPEKEKCRAQSAA